MLDDHPFALCLTHDLDRPYKTYQVVYDAAAEPGRAGYHLGGLLSDENPYWQFEDLRALESSLGVRSAVYALREPSLLTARPRAWLRPANWIEHAGRYDPSSPEIAAELRSLDDGGWEVGLHGSRRAARDPHRLEFEADRLTSILGHEVTGGRQHHLRHGPRTWAYYRDAGLRYDSSLGSSTEVGFRHGYRPFRPFDDEFLVLPLTLMEVALPDPDERFEAAWATCEALLTEAADNGAVATALWHPRYLSEREFPGYRRLYRRLVEAALERDAWVGPPADLVDAIDARSTTDG